MEKTEVIGQIRDLVQEPAFAAKRQQLASMLDDGLATLAREVRDKLDELRRTSAALGLFITNEIAGDTMVRFDALATEVRGRLAKLLVMDSLVELPERLQHAALPAGILGQFPIAASYICATTVEQDDASYGERLKSDFDRDLRICQLFSLPAGAQIFDLNVWLPKSFYRYQGLGENLRCLAFVVLKLVGRGPLYRIHTDTRNLTDFNEDGWNRCYVRIAEMLEQTPDVRGIVGTSWFYDPQLLQISPQLRYLQTVPLSAGAFLRIDGPGEIHTKRAITRSPTRKRLFEEGSYKPVCATLVWPRKPMIEWARQQGIV